MAILNKFIRGDRVSIDSFIGTIEDFDLRHDFNKSELFYKIICDDESIKYIDQTRLKKIEKIKD